MRALPLCLALLLAPAVTAGVDRVTLPARGLRYERHTLRRGALRTTVHALFVDLCDPAVSLRATTPEEGPRAVSAWARAVGAAAAVNGDYFDLRTRQPLGPARGDGRWWPDAPREHHDALLLASRDGRVDLVECLDAPTLWTDAAQRVTDPWTEVIAARERILVRGVVRESPFVNGRGERHPRTGVGLSADRHTLILAVVQGRSERASGATARELGEILRDLGAWDGMKLDGGGSSTMYLAAAGVVNAPSDGAERSVATHLGVLVRPGVPARPSRCVSARSR